MRNLKESIFTSKKFKSLAALLISTLLTMPFVSVVADESNKEISDEAERMYSARGLELAKKLQIQLRTLAESLVNKGINTSLYLENIEPTEAGQQVDPILKLVTDHFAKFCSKGSSSESQVSPECKTDIALQHGDLKLSTVLGSARLDSDKSEAADSFTRNLIDPNPDSKLLGGKTSDGKPITLERISKEPALRKDLAELLVNQTLLSVARYAFAQMIAMRTPVEGSDLTMMEMFEQQGCQRMLNAAWQKTMKDAYAKAMNCDPNKGCDPSKPLDPTKTPDPAKAAAIEVAVMDAARTCFAFQALQQQEVNQALLVGLLVNVYRQGQEARSIVNAAQPNLENVKEGTTSEKVESLKEGPSEGDYKKTLQEVPKVQAPTAPPPK